MGLKFSFLHFPFSSTNSLGAEVLYEKTREYVGETKDKWLSLTCTAEQAPLLQIISLPVARKVVGVEIVEEAVEAAGECGDEWS